MYFSCSVKLDLSAYLALIGRGREKNKSRSEKDSAHTYTQTEINHHHMSGTKAEFVKHLSKAFSVLFMIQRVNPLEWTGRKATRFPKKAMLMLEIEPSIFYHKSIEVLGHERKMPAKLVFIHKLGNFYTETDEDWQSLY